ncbi:MAG: hypothetical protein Q8P17_00655 [bacterium]|nr:hypothetical protein [bacterium]
MTGRRKYSGPDRRKNGGRSFKNADEILKNKTLAAEKFAQYKIDEGVGIKSMFTLAILTMFFVVAVVGLSSHWVFVWTGIIGFIASLVFGGRWINSAKKKARARFEKDPNRHLIEYLPS